jgi:hypothetical protein
MRSFVTSALMIAIVLIGQQWVAKSSDAQGLSATPTAIGVAR